MTDTAREMFAVYFDLYQGRSVFFHDVEGVLRVANVSHVWWREQKRELADAPPLVNLEFEDSSELTSVPHHRDVPGAKSFYWTFSGASDE